MNRIFSALILAVGLAFCIPTFAAEIEFGQNHLICENEQFGKFDLAFNVVDNVVETEFYKAENAEPVPSWETLETELTSLEFTSGTLLVPSGVKGSLPGATLKVVRNVFPQSPSPGLIQAALTIPKSLNFPTEFLMIDHNHPEKYETKALGAQAVMNSVSLTLSSP
jgi:hypothetical protein